MPSNKFYITKGSLAIVPNDFGQPNMVRIYTLGKCTLTYYAVSDKLVQDGTPDYLYPSWALRTGNIKFYYEESEKIYLYAACLKKDKSGMVVLSNEQKSLTPEGDYYFISIGYLSPVENRKRTFFPDFGISIEEQGGHINDGINNIAGIWEKRKDASDKEIAYTKLPVVSEESFQAPVIGPLKRNYGTPEKWSTEFPVDFEKGLMIGGNLVNLFYKTGEKVEEVTDNMVMTALKAVSEFISKTKPDRTEFLLTMAGGAQFTPDFIPGILTGVGAMIDKYGNGELESLVIRRFLEVPELRFNRVDVKIGDKWRAPGAGIIQEVDVERQIVTLKLEEGEIGAVGVGDICMGIFHALESSDNADLDSDDSLGNRTFAGFFTVYFHITEVIGSMNEQFRYQLRPESERWRFSFHPCQSMNFVAYGNFSNKERQTSVYETRTYTRMLRGQNTWEIAAGNIALQYGDMTNMSVHGMNMAGYSMYLNNAYITGSLNQMNPDGTVTKLVTDRGAWSNGTVAAYYDRYSYEGGLWLCVNEEGTGNRPSKDDPSWELQVSPGAAGTPGIIPMGYWSSYNVPYKATSLVSFAGAQWYAKRETSVPPISCILASPGVYLTTQYGYIPLGDKATHGNPDDWEMWVENGVPGTPGIDGKVYYTWIRYADTTSGEGISDDPTEKIFMGLAYNKETPTESGNPKDYAWSRFRGEDGTDGIGVPGTDGKTYYTWLAYSDHADGSGMYQTPTDATKYIGIAVNKETAVESTNPADYSWSRFKGEDGVAGIISMGHWSSYNVPYKATSLVSFAGAQWYAKRETSVPPISCILASPGVYLTTQYGYIPLGDKATYGNPDDWEMWVENGTDGKPGEDGKPGGDGKQGIEGCIIRKSEWTPDVEWRNDEGLTSGTRYLDVALIRDNALASGWQAYKCKVTHVSSTASAPGAGADVNGNNTWWERFGLNVNAIFTSLIIAKDAQIDFLQGNQLLIKKDDGTVTAGLSGSESGGKVRFWAGSDWPDYAPFRVNESGKLFASNAEISGIITADSGKIGGFTIDNGTLWWKGYDYFGGDSRSVRIGVPTDEKSGMVDVSFNAATSGRFGVKIIGSNLGGACIYASRYSEERDRTYPHYSQTYAGYFDGGLFIKETVSSRLCLADSFGTIIERKPDGTLVYNEGIDYNFGTMLFRKGILVRSN